MSPRVRAVLGPTNTGKTHLAIDRLLAHASGIIGFPLRLLARENYDKMVAAKGARAVALITGEEKIIPPEARWYSCTVEAMPMDRPVEFVAVDEIQLCADPDRGHVFTDRLLHARGMVETMFLGAETIRGQLKRLVPQAEIETRARLSQLHYAGVTKLSRLPPRSAVVAFSAAEVYAIAELIRRRRGGCAVVMGRLSPRTRNAQVALYQDKEVDFLVATDAIGMGLNMDVNHVAFASLSKFDGHRPRMLTAAETAQIAGRAGRGMRDGSFGTAGTCPPLPASIVEAVEQHRFDPLEQLFWRNSDLDFSTIDTLLAALAVPPPGPGLARGNEASDVETLATLARDSGIRALACSRARVRLLWEACQVPDFRKLADESHARLCGRIFSHVAREGGLPEAWLAAAIEPLGRVDGDIDTLMQRLSGVRVWSYVTARTDWVRDAMRWQAETSAIEDRISDALHERLIARFVDRRAARLTRQLEAGQDLLSAVTSRGDVVVEGHSVGQMDGFRFTPDPVTESDERKLMLRAARRALRDEVPRRVAALETAALSAFTWSEDQTMFWEQAPVARVRRGASLLRPVAEILDSEFLEGHQRERVRIRLQAVLEGWVRSGLAPLFAAQETASRDSALRGVLHRLMESGGIAAPVDVPAPLRGKLKAAGIWGGRHALFLPALLKPRPARLRARLCALWNHSKLPSAAPPGAVSMTPPADWPTDLNHTLAQGFVAAGPVLVRLDIAERITAELAFATRRGQAVLPAGVASRLSIQAAHLPAVLRGLGFQVVPSVQLGPGELGPTLPAAILPMRPRRARPAPAPVVAVNKDSPFAALARLRTRA